MTDIDNMTLADVAERLSANNHELRVRFYRGLWYVWRVDLTEVDIKKEGLYEKDRSLIGALRRILTRAERGES